MTDYAIDAADVVKRYPFMRTTRKGGRNIFKAVLGLDRANIVALNKATFHVRKGETFGLLGPNGAGKTTIIKILSTILTYEEGDVYVNGIDVGKHPNDVLRNLQTVLTGSRGFEWRLSASQSLRLYAALYGLSRREADERIDHLIDEMGLRGYENMMYQRFSSGMGRRLLLARALLIDVPILLFDEPTANLDPVSAVKFRHLIKGLSTVKGKTVLLATHNMFEAQEMCDTIAIIDKGKVIATGSPSEVRRLIGGKIKIDLGLQYLSSDLDGDLVRTLEATPSITKVEVRNKGDRVRTISIEATPELDINGLLRGILSQNVVIRTLETSYPSLEDAFVALTGGERR
jgi:ABC-2 type transport system ATP-binding protein